MYQLGVRVWERQFIWVFVLSSLTLFEDAVCIHGDINLCCGCVEQFLPAQAVLWLQRGGVPQLSEQRWRSLSVQQTSEGPSNIHKNIHILYMYVFMYIFIFPFCPHSAARPSWMWKWICGARRRVRLWQPSGELKKKLRHRHTHYNLLTILTIIAFSRNVLDKERAAVRTAPWLRAPPAVMDSAAITARYETGKAPHPSV